MWPWHARVTATTCIRCCVDSNEEGWISFGSTFILGGGRRAQPRKTVTPEGHPPGDAEYRTPEPCSAYRIGT